MTDSRWLDEDEMRAWRVFVTTTVLLFEQLDRELKAAHGLTHDDYAILVNLSEAPDQRLRMTDLATRVLESKSRLSHHVSRLEKDGLVLRESCPNDLRGMFAVLTPAGRRKLRRAAPDHVQSVRQHFIGRLDPTELRSLADALESVARELPTYGQSGTAPSGDCGGLSGGQGTGSEDGDRPRGGRSRSRTRPVR